MSNIQPDAIKPILREGKYQQRSKSKQANRTEANKQKTSSSFYPSQRKTESKHHAQRSMPILQTNPKRSKPADKEDEKNN